MSNPTITCEQFADTLADFLERDVADSTRAAMEAHALGCGECGSLLADLRRLRIDAANLPELAPSRDLWSGISARIETPVVDLTSRTANAGTPNRRRVPRGVWLGLAAAGLVAITATVTHRMTKQSLDRGGVSAVAANPPGSSSARPSTDSALRVAQRPETTAQPAPARTTSVPQPSSATRLVVNPTSKLTAEQTYGVEISRLLLIYDRKQSQLDTATVAVLRKNLQIIDDAIAQCRLALRKDPASRFLMQSLNDALDTKVQLLRTATMLPSRT
jgi:hypothetical protein